MSAYTTALHQPVGHERIAVTASGVSALMLAMQMLVNAASEVVAVVPVGPNLTAQPAILGARVTRVPLVSRDDAWTLDLDRLLGAITPATGALLVNAANNPTGWMLTWAEQQALLDQCRRTGTWIVADEVYERIWFGDGPLGDGPLGAEPPQAERAPQGPDRDPFGALGAQAQASCGPHRARRASWTTPTPTTA